MKTCPHIWTRINQTLKQCQGCGVLRTMKPRRTQPSRERDETPLEGITTREICERYHVGDSLPLKLHQRGLIYRIRRGLYDARSVEEFFRHYEPHERPRTAFGESLPPRPTRHAAPLVDPGGRT